MSTLEVNQISPSTGTTVTIGGSGDTVTLGSGATQSGFGGVNAPYFEAYLPSNQDSVSQATDVKVQLSTENFDSGGNFDNSTNYRFTPTVAGKYFIYGAVTVYGGDVTALTAVSAKIKKNGSIVRFSDKNYTSNHAYVISTTVSGIIDFNGSTDYVELFGYLQSTGTGRFQGGNSQTYFGGYRIIE